MGKEDVPCQKGMKEKLQAILVQPQHITSIAGGSILFYFLPCALLCQSAVLTLRHSYLWLSDQSELCSASHALQGISALLSAK